METVTERSLIKQFYISNDYIIVKHTEFVFEKNISILSLYKKRLHHDYDHL